MNFGNVAKNYTNLTRTENNAVALKTTDSDLLDLFASSGALRGFDYLDVRNMFLKAINEDRLLATKLMFYTRNIRGGLGERNTFRHMLIALAHFRPDIIEKNINLIPYFGRFDDWYSLAGTPCEDVMWKAMESQFSEDLDNYRKGKPISLLAKWMKSVNTSSETSRKLGKMTAKRFALSERGYRKVLSTLRSHLDVVEKKMSRNDWDKINYEKIPSRAMNLYRNAFKTHDSYAFSEYMENVKSGNKKINAGTLYPYDILMKGKLRTEYKVTPNTSFGRWSQNVEFVIDEDDVLEELWKALPNYIEGENNILVMADTSGSMEVEGGRPLATSLGLSLYFAERNFGAYKNLFLTFSETPKYHLVKGETLKEKLSGIQSEIANTNLESAFDMILSTAVMNSISPKEMPKSLIIISDMHFDQAIENSNAIDTFYTKMKDKFSLYGYEIPTIIFWNVAQRGNAFQVRKGDANVMLVSGQSTSTFKSILGNMSKTPYEFMVETLNDPQYDCVKV
jgi:hypothetical protein